MYVTSKRLVHHVRPTQGDGAQRLREYGLRDAVAGAVGVAGRDVPKRHHASPVMRSGSHSDHGVTLPAPVRDSPQRDTDAGGCDARVWCVEVGRLQDRADWEEPLF